MKRSAIVDADDLATELHKEITRSELALAFRRLVLTPLHTNTSFQADCRGAYNHMAVSTLNLAFITIARLFDRPKGRHSITLQFLIERIRDLSANNARINSDAEKHLQTITDVRLKLSHLRNNAIAHRNITDDVSPVSWDLLEEVLDDARKIFDWCGSERGQAYSYSTHLRGYRGDCRRLLEALVNKAPQPGPNCA